MRMRRISEKQNIGSCLCVARANSVRGVCLTMMKTFVAIFLFLQSKSVCGNLWCYSCVSSQPGCTEHEVNWLIHSAVTCPQSDDKCVKIVDRKGSDVTVTRDCLSNVIHARKDIPADRYEGCRPAAAQPKLATFVENHVIELDINRAYWDQTTYCFCQFDEWCNDAPQRTQSLPLFFAFFIMQFFFY